MYKDLEGIEIEITGDRGLVLDTRKSVDKPKVIGLIIPAFSGRGFTFCPFVRRHLVFDRKIPDDNFRTPQRAGEWLKRHSVSFVKQRYTPFNGFLRVPYALPDSRLSSLRAQIIIIMVLFAIFLAFYPSGNWAMFFLTKGLAVCAVVGALVNTYLLLRVD